VAGCHWQAALMSTASSLAPWSWRGKKKGPGDTGAGCRRRRETAPICTGPNWRKPRRQVGGGADPAKPTPHKTKTVVFF
jgi:hypothetical protein